MFGAAFGVADTLRASVGFDLWLTERWVKAQRS